MVEARPKDFVCWLLLLEVGKVPNFSVELFLTFGRGTFVLRQKDTRTSRATRVGGTGRSYSMYVLYVPMRKTTTEYSTEYPR